MDSIDPAFDSEDMEHCEEVLCVFFEAGGQSAHILHLAKEPLDDIAHGIEISIVRDRFSGVTFGRNNAQCAFFGDLCSDFTAAISLVCNDGERRLIPVQKGVHHLAIMNIAARYGEPQGAALGIYGSVNLARPTAS